MYTAKGGSATEFRSCAPIAWSERNRVIRYDPRRLRPWMAEVSDSCSGEDERLQTTTTGGARLELEAGRMTHTSAFCASKLSGVTLP